MMDTVFYRLMKIFPVLLPSIFTITVIILCHVPYHMPYLTTLSPEVMLIYYFYIFIPRYFNIPFVFAIGILQDALLGIPIGISSTNNLIVAFITYNQRNLLIYRSFSVILVSFVITSIICFTTKSLVALIFFGVEANYIELAEQCISSILLYPIMHYFLHMTVKRIYE